MKLQWKLFLLLLSHYCLTGNIQDYSYKYRNDVKNIALPNIASLVNFFAYKWDKKGVRERACEEQVLSVLDAKEGAEDYKSRIFLSDEGQVLGFINYCYSKPWFDPYSSRVMVEHLAVDEEYRGKGIGQALMEDMETACRQNGVDVVKLYTNGDNLFYHRLGYNAVRVTRLQEHTYKKRLTPHPIIRLGLYLIKRIGK